MTNYYELDVGPYRAENWTLDGLFDRASHELDSRQFTYGNYIELGPPLRLSLFNDERIVDVAPPLKVSIRTSGAPPDFTFSGDAMPIVTAAVKDLVISVATPDVQAIPVLAEGRDEWYYILNITKRIRCIDTSRSVIQWWPEEIARPEKLGKPEMITKLVINPDSVGEHHIFRIQDWEVSIIVSETLKDILEQSNASGISFRRV